MTQQHKRGAPSGVTWDGIDWADVQRQVRRLQIAYCEGDTGWHA